jgi:hypothetical protein
VNQAPKRHTNGALHVGIANTSIAQAAEMSGDALDEYAALFDRKRPAAVMTRCKLGVGQSECHGSSASINAGPQCCIHRGPTSRSQRRSSARPRCRRCLQPRHDGSAARLAAVSNWP